MYHKLTFIFIKLRKIFVKKKNYSIQLQFQYKEFTDQTHSISQSEIIESKKEIYLRYIWSQSLILFIPSRILQNQRR